ncbi:hypothetical protein GP486_006041 [Trichoglossum hirsutum]|uniref:HNH nuclease domain-containing protein n=1 Tax=Trichoglossum hirsutum TaxID=265104 RepID=A0A9P8L836_9PEZI|nr:hypothetical protein GP486_006041 [Trichoglossum hirsutum]
MLPQIPLRYFSLAAIEDARLKNKASRQDLKRKLSDTSLIEGSERYLKLRIEEVELEREDLELERDRMDWEMNEKKLDEKVYRKAQQSTNKRIISLGDDLWQFKRQLRTHDEKAGKLELLTPDSEGAFAAALLHLYKDPKKGKNRDTTLQNNMRRDSIAAYRSLGSDVETTDDPQITAGIRCTLSGEYFRPNHVKAAHIVPVQLGVELADYIFGKGTGARLFSVDNCLMLHEDIERAFDKGILVFVPVNPAERPIRRWKTVLLNEASRNQVVFFKAFKTLGDVDGMELKFRSEHRPAARFLYYHFVVSLLRCRQQREPGWENIWVKLRTGQPWPTPGRYLRQSMLLVLAKTVGNLSEGEIEGLVQERAFDVPERMAHSEEEEIARRVLEVHQELEEECLRKEENEEGEDEEEDE